MVLDSFSVTKNFHVISTGTSVLGNFLRESSRNEKYKELVTRYRMENWDRLSPDDEVQKDIEPHIMKGSRIHEVLLEFIRGNPKGVSAELNSFLSFLEAYGQSKASVEVALYCTDTPNNRLCAQLVYEYLSEMGFKMVGEPIRIRGIGARGWFDLGLVEILDKVVRIIVNKSKQGFDIYISATAGFKPETTFFVLAAALCSLKSPTVYYIHESFREVVTLPLPPLDISKEYFDVIRLFKEPQDQNYAVDYLKKHGFRLEDMINKGVLEQESGFLIIAKEWIRKLIELKELTRP